MLSMVDHFNGLQYQTKGHILIWNERRISPALEDKIPVAVKVVTNS